MGIGLSGMISGLDTDSIVKAMVSGQQLKATKIENKITLNKWTNDAWSGLNTKIYSFYTKFASKLRLQSSYMTRTAKSSDESAVTATAGSSAAVGTHTLEIHKLASSQYVTGAQLTNSEGGKANYSKTSKLSELGVKTGATLTIGTENGKKEVSFTVESDSTINDFLEACKDAGVNANFDTNQQRFFISSQESGAEHAFTLSADGKTVTGMDEVTKRVALDYLDKAEKALYDSAVKTLSKAAMENPDDIDKAVEAVKKDDFDINKASELEKAVYDLTTIAKDSRAEKMADEAAEVDGLSKEEAAKRKADIQKLMQDTSVAIADIDTTKYSVAEIEAISDARTTLTNVEGNIHKYMTRLAAEEWGDDAAAASLEAMGLGSKRTEIAASDAEFVLDGAIMTESSNSFTVNGITLNLSKTTENKDVPNTYDAVQITVGKDSESTYNLVKEALTEYNKLIEEMNKLYNADSARGYDPLTDEQKEQMTEDDIKNWEDKIKGSLLRRDNTLGTLLSSMRTALSATYKDEETGKSYSLSSYGIVTGNYTENGKLHIYGDEDDATYATYTDRLKKALEEDPDQVMETLTHVFGKLYETMTEKCAKTEISSALTFYNDKQYNKLLKGYEKDLDTMEDRIKEMEEKYYKQFTAMETAMSKLQSQQNSLASLLGQTVQQ
ncbi:MAG: flagellar filament capping protein FliD [Lachnospiraceae bacterium]|nr:flagellar filament capping protein FliD [Lachnospiraceae bacterium]